MYSNNLSSFPPVHPAQRRPSGSGSFTGMPPTNANPSSNSGMNASAFFGSSTPAASPMRPPTQQSIGKPSPMNPMRMTSQGSAAAAFNNNSAVPRSNESLSTMTNRTDFQHQQHATPIRNTSVPKTINVTANANLAQPAKHQRAMSTGSAKDFFSSIPTLAENPSVSSEQEDVVNVHSNASYSQQEQTDPVAYESPALNTAVNLFSKTASALYASTTKAVEVAENVGGNLQSLKTEFVNMTAPMEQQVSSLPAGWQELKDETNGRMYYFHAEKNVTQWEKPVEDPTSMENMSSNQSVHSSASMPVETLSVQDDNASQNMVEVHMDLNMNMDSSVKEDTTEGNTDLEDGWQEIVDPTSGNVYYFHAEKNVTQWEKPVKKFEEVAPVAVENVSSNQSVHSSASMPVETLSVQDDNVSQNMVEDHMDLNMNMDSSVKEDTTEGNTDLEDGWQEIVDPTSGNVYYFHAEKNVTQWEKPVKKFEEVAPVAVENVSSNQSVHSSASMPVETLSVQDDNVSQNMVEDHMDLNMNMDSSVKEDTTEGNTDLEDGWQEIVDPTSGNVYYFHAEKNVTQWEKPVKKFEEVAPVAVENVSSNQSVHSSASMPVETLSVQDDNVSQNMVEDHMDLNMNMDSSVKEDTTEGNTDLEDGWQEIVDPTSGNVYYFHAEKNVTQWEKPVKKFEEVAPVAVENVSSNQSVHSSSPVPVSSSAVTSSNSVRSASPLPPPNMNNNGNMSASALFGSQVSGETFEQQQEKVEYVETTIAPATLALVQEQTSPTPVTVDPNATVTSKFFGGAHEEQREAKSEGIILTEELSGPSHTIQQVQSSEPPPTTQPTPSRVTGNVIEPSPARSTSSLFSRPPMRPSPTSTPVRDAAFNKEPIVASTPVQTISDATEGFTPRPTPIQSKPLPTFSKPRLPSPIPRQPRSSATPERRNLKPLPLPNKKPLPLPQFKRNNISKPSSGDYGSVGTDKSSNSTSGIGKFRVPPPLQLNISPNRRAIPKETETATTSHQTENKENVEIDNHIETVVMASEVNATSNALAPVESTEIPAENVVEAKLQAEEKIAEVEMPTSTEDYAAESNLPEVKLPAEEKLAEVLMPASTEETPATSNLPPTENALDKISTPTESANCTANSHATAEDVTSEDETINSPVAVPPPPVSILPPLPADWMEFTAPDSGMKYYVNISTRVTQWERPLPEGFQPPLPPPKSLESADIVESVLEPSKEYEVAKMESPPQTCNKEQEENTQKIISDVAQEFVTPIISNASNLIPTPTEIPPHLSNPEITSPTNCAIESEVENEIVTEPESNIELEETERWVELIDESTGNPYYYNEANGESSWERPSSLSTNITNQVPELPEEYSEVALEHVEEPEQEFALNHEGMEENDVDETEGGNYDRPEEEQESTELQTPALPKGWVEMYDESSAQPYYVNELLGITQWEVPTDDNSFPSNENDSTAVNDAEIEADEIAQNDAEIEADEIAQNDADNEEIPEDNQSGMEDLPLGWIEMFDDNSNLPYYVNEAEGITQWEKPSIDTLEGDDTMGNDISNQEIVEDEISFEKNEDPLESEHATSVSSWVKVSNDDSGNESNLNKSDNILLKENSEDFAHVSENNEQQQVGDNFETSLDMNPEVIESSEDVLPVGWEKVFDESSGQYYYRPDVVNEHDVSELSDFQVLEPTRMEKDGELESEPFDDKPYEEKNLDTSSDSPLPSGWEKMIDESSGQFYYVNEDENITQWETPEKDSDPVISDDPVNQNEEIPANIDEVVNEESVPTIDADVTSTDLPDGWEEVIDESSGQIYYYNEVENLTQWDRPKAENEMSTEKVLQNDETHDNVDDVISSSQVETELSQEPIVNDMLVTNDVNDKKQNDLPKGWEEVIDETSGQPYYFNATENITQWEKPEFSEEAIAPDTTAAASDPTEENDNLADLNQPFNDIDEDTNDLPDGWEELIDESTGQVYYFNSELNQTQWDRPVLEKNTPEKDTEQVADSIGGDTPEEKLNHDEVNQDALTSLPLGWEELVDESSGQTYYFNELKNITQWERPDSDEIQITNDDNSMTDSQEQIDEITEQISLSQPKEEEEEVDEDGDMDLPIGWVKLVDENSGDPYYFNEVENITQWEKPECKEANADGVASTGSNADEQPEESTTDLPPGWTEAVDETSGDVYYYNEVTNVTQWEKPSFSEKAMEEDVDQIKKGTVSSNNSARSSQDWIKVDTQEDKGAESKAKEVSNSLPPGWEECEDPSSGNVYYCNEKENITQWERPVLKEKITSQFKPLMRPRPPHALISFGFGGRVCVMRPQKADSLGINKENKVNTLRRGPIEVHRLHSLLPEDSIPSRNHEGKPFVDLSDDDVFKFIEGKCGEGKSDEQLLWNLISIAARWKGRLRSAEGYKNPTSVEASIVALLLRSRDIAFSNLISPSYVLNQQASELCLKEVQTLLLKGEREEALKCALSGGDHALAFLIASLCGPSAYHTAAKYFIDKKLQIGTPLYTATSLFANQMLSQKEAGDAADSFWKKSSDKIDESWQHHLATILSNQTKGWQKVVTALGDSLLYKGHTEAAHCCYLVSGRPITNPSDPATRLVLIGCDHRKQKHIALMTEESWEAYLRTEVFEWTKRKGNPNAVITALQPFKLQYAILLADFGFEAEAKAYIESVRKCTGLLGPSSQTPQNTGMYPAEFLKRLEIFGDRICTSMGIPNENMKKTGLKGMLSNLVNISKADESFHDPVFTDASFEEHVEHEVDDADRSFVSAKSNLMDTSINSFATTKSKRQKAPMERESKKQPTIEEEPTPEEINTPITQPTFMAAPIPIATGKENAKPKFMPSPHMPNLESGDKAVPIESKPVKPAAATPLKKEVIAPTPKSTPAPKKAQPTMTTPADRKPKEEAPSSASSRFSLSGWIAKKLNPDATVADAGGAMEAYYDEKLKRWIFPGDDPQEVAKPLAPPPTTPMTTEKKEVSTPAPASDPLGMMMAPPPARTPSSNLMAPPSRGTPSASLRGPPMIPRNLNTPQGTPAPKPANNVATAPPQFVIFTPSATEKKESED